MDKLSDIAVKIDHQLSLRDSSIVEEQGEEVQAERNSQQYDDGEDDYEFSFACAEASSPISAEDLFHNGQIRPIAPLRIPLEEMFVERSDRPPELEEEDVDGVAEEPKCARTRRNASAAPEACRKSNSTGFSRLWRFRDLLIRSQSDGKETFVFLTENGIEKKETTSSSSSSKKKKKNESSRTEKKSSSAWKGKKGSTAAESKTTSSKANTMTSSSAYAMQYGKNGEKGREKRRSYLPYRQDLVGFFTNANAISRNIHPY